MKSPKNYVIALLALTTLTGGAVAWNQYQELIKLRAAALDFNRHHLLELLRESMNFKPLTAAPAVMEQPELEILPGTQTLE